MEAMDRPTALEIDREIDRLTGFAAESYSNLDICIKLDLLRDKFRRYVGEQEVFPPFNRTITPPRPTYRGN